MLRFIFKLILFSPKLLFFLSWNKTTWLILFLGLVVVGMYIAYKRIYVTFRRVKVGGKKTVLITGGSGGIGFGFAKLFAEDQYNVIIIARNEEKLEKSRKELSKFSGPHRVFAWRFDLADDETPKKIFEKLEEEDIQVDILLNNAAISNMGYFVDLPESSTTMIMANCTALVNLTRQILPGMISRNYGIICNVSSVGGLAPCPFCSAYGATKAFIRSFSIALNAELMDEKNVSCCLFYPGWTKTDLVQGELKKWKMTRSEFQSKVGGGLSAQTADECAYEGYRGLLSRQEEVVAGTVNFVFGKVVMSLLPTWVVMKMLIGMLKPMVDENRKNQ